MNIRKLALQPSDDGGIVLTDKETGELIHGVRSIEIRSGYDQLTEATIVVVFGAYGKREIPLND